MQSIAFDDPWLAAALEDGSALLLNVDAAMRGGRSGEPMHSCWTSSSKAIMDKHVPICT